MQEPVTAEDQIALCDGAAHARVLAQQLAMTVGEITARYPNNKLGGLVERLRQLAAFAEGGAGALASSAETAMRRRPELANAAPDQPLATPPDILAIFEHAEVVTSFLTVAEAAQIAAQGKLVVLRDERVQANHLVPKGAVIFGPDVDRATVHLWWPRIFSREMCVAIMATTVKDVWLETTYAAEDLPVPGAG